MDKDAWIRTMLRRRYLIVRPDGSILRANKVDAQGNPEDAGYSELRPRIHKRTGRVYANFTYLGIKKSLLINRIVAIRFHPNPLNLPQVNHIDGNKENNHPRNLEWASASDNERHAHRTGLKTGRGSANSNAKLTAAQVQEIRSSSLSDAEIAAKFGVSRSTVVNVRKRRTWKHLP